VANPKFPSKADVKTEADWEEEIIEEALGDALLPDGRIDFEKLRSKGLTLSLDELHSEGDEDDEA
jgi:hypothetical protein